MSLLPGEFWSREKTWIFPIIFTTHSGFLNIGFEWRMVGNFVTGYGRNGRGGIGDEWYRWRGWGCWWILREARSRVLRDWFWQSDVDRRGEQRRSLARPKYIDHRKHILFTFPISLQCCCLLIKLYENMDEKWLRNFHKPIYNTTLSKVSLNYLLNINKTWKNSTIHMVSQMQLFKI